MKRTPMKRSPLLRVTGEARLTVKVRKCAVKACRQPFVPRSMTHKACGNECAEIIGKAQAAKIAARAAIADKQQTRKQLEALKSLSTLRAEAQAEINRYTRLRDRAAGYGCICCGKALDWSGGPGGAVDAGHYIARGGSIELSFVEANINAQRKSCNRPGGTTRAQFRAGMIARHGLEVVEWLEGPPDLPHYKHDDYRRIKALYRAKWQQLEKQQ